MTVLQLSSPIQRWYTAHATDEMTRENSVWLTISGCLLGDHIAFRGYTSVLVSQFTWSVKELFREFDKEEAITERYVREIVHSMDEQRTMVVQNLEKDMDNVEGSMTWDFPNVPVRKLSAGTQKLLNFIRRQTDSKMFKGLRFMSVNQAISDIEGFDAAKELRSFHPWTAKEFVEHLEIMIKKA